MRLSDDGKILINVTAADLVDGRLIIPGTVEVIGTRACYCLQELEETFIPEGVFIRTQAFARCANLKELILSENVYIDYQSFIECSGIQELEIPAGITFGYLAKHSAV